MLERFTSSIKRKIILPAALALGTGFVAGRAGADPVELDPGINDVRFGSITPEAHVSSLRRISRDTFSMLVALLQPNQEGYLAGGTDVNRVLYKLVKTGPTSFELVRISPVMSVLGLNSEAGEGAAVEVDQDSGASPRLFAKGPHTPENDMVVEIGPNGDVLPRGFRATECRGYVSDLFQSPFSGKLGLMGHMTISGRMESENAFILSSPLGDDLCVQLRTALDNAQAAGLTPEQAGILEGAISLITRDEKSLARAEGFAAVTRQIPSGLHYESFLLVENDGGNLRNLQRDATGRWTEGGGITSDPTIGAVGGAVRLNVDGGVQIVLVDHIVLPAGERIARAHVFTVNGPADLQEEVATTSVAESRIAEADGDGDGIPDFNPDGSRRDLCPGKANPGEVDVSSPLSAVTPNGIPDACENGDLGYLNKVVEANGSSIASNQAIEVVGGVINVRAGQEIRYIHSAPAALDAQPSHTMQIASGYSFSIDAHDVNNLTGVPGGTLTISYNTFDDPFGDPVVVTLTGPGTWSSGAPVIGAMIASSGTDYTVRVGTEGWVVPTPDAGTSVPDAGTSSPDGGFLPDAVTPLSDSVTHLPDAEYLTDAVAPLPDAVMLLPDAVAPLPDSATIPTDGGFLPDAVTPLPDSVAHDDAGKEGESESEGERNDGGPGGSDSGVIEQPTSQNGCGGCNAGNDTPAGIQNIVLAAFALAFGRKRRRKGNKEK